MLNKTVIDLGALRQNAKRIKSKLDKGVKLCAVVKADAYGHGAEEVANALYNIADVFAVATTEEGIKLRIAGIDKEILVLIPPFESDLVRAVEANLTLAVSDRKKLERIERECLRQNRSVGVHIKYNTGMNRLGADLEEFERTLKFFDKNRAVRFEGVFSHFACPENDERTSEAVNDFLLAKSKAIEYNKNVICHISASGGFLKGYQFDMVRTGILLYGYEPFKSGEIKLKKVMREYAPVVERRRVKAGELFLYGDEPTDSDGVYAIVRYGYADGGLRNSGEGLQRRRCMDLSAVQNAKGKFVRVLFDAQREAEKRGTVCYEVLCARGRRNERIYLR